MPKRPNYGELYVPVPVASTETKDNQASDQSDDHATTPTTRRSRKLAKRARKEREIRLAPMMSKVRHRQLASLDLEDSRILALSYLTDLHKSQANEIYTVGSAARYATLKLSGGVLTFLIALGTQGLVTALTTWIGDRTEVNKTAVIGQAISFFVYLLIVVLVLFILACPPQNRRYVTYMFT